MATTFAHFLSGTNIVDIQPNKPQAHIINLNWELSSYSVLNYSRVEIYRYIGIGNTCSDRATVEAKKVKILEIIANNINSITVKKYSPSGTSSNTYAMNILDYKEYTDNFTNFYNSGISLKTFHSLVDSTSTDDKKILNDIYYSNRTIFYVLKTYVQGFPDPAPYCIGVHPKQGIVSNTSTKTQVRHDTLYYEGDICWATLVGPGASINPNKNISEYAARGGVSRTSVDIRPLPLSEHVGPTGRGGNVWVSSRNTGYIYHLNLGNGLQTLKYHHPDQQYQDTDDIGGAGGGIAVDTNPNSQDCFAINHFYGKEEYEQTTKLIKLTYNGAPGNEYLESAPLLTINSSTVNFNGGYGTANLLNHPELITISQYRSLAKYNTITKTRVQFPPSPNPAIDPKRYGICSGPDGSLFSTSVDHQGPATTIMTILPNNTYSSITTVPWWIGCTTDNYFTYPNHLTQSRFHYHLFATAETAGKTSTHPARTAQIVDYCFNTNTLSGSSVFNTNGSYRGVGIDGENNVWGMGSQRGKIYRMQNNTTYPTGGLCRYPTLSLDEWPGISITNTREIEWFLSRDFQSMDNTTSVGVSGTAVAAWLSLIENKRFETFESGMDADTKSNLWLKHNPVGGFDTIRETGGVSTYTRNYGIRMKNHNNKSLCMSQVIDFYNLYCNVNSPTCYPSLSGIDRINAINSNNTGLRVHPNYALLGTNPTYGFGHQTVYNLSYKPNWANSDTTTPSYELVLSNFLGYSYQYSDFTGNLLISQVDETLLDTLVTHPAVTYPQLITTVSAYQSNPGYQDVPSYCYPWKITVPETSSRVFSITGYDDLNVTFQVSADMGSFLLTEFGLYTNDYYPQIFGDIHASLYVTKYYNTDYNNLHQYTKVVDFNYSYDTPSKTGLYYLPSGLPLGDSYYPYYNTDGVFSPYTTASVRDLYLGYYTGSCRTITTSANNTIGVLERWPEPKFYIEASDLSANRYDMFTNHSWSISRFDKSSETYKESQSDDAKRFDTTYGVDPLSGIIEDRSIARTFPISSWQMSLSTNNFRVGWPSDIQSFNWTTNPYLSVGQDEQNYYDYLSARRFRYGDYLLTLNVQASTTSTSSDKTFVQYISVRDFEPFANFWAISAYTVSSTFENVGQNLAANIYSINTIPNGQGTDFTFISGYAPNLTIYFVDSSEAHTFPICEYNWDFNDPYNEGPDDVMNINSNYYTVTTNNILRGTFDDPSWLTDKVNHISQHTYVMPGTYDVTLTVKASETNTQDICARYLDTDIKRFYVLVEEIKPQCGFEVIGTVSGGSPLTAYFVASSTIAGSFGIGKIAWNFGDGTTDTITRYPIPTLTHQGLPIYSVSAINYDVYDVRNYVVPHVYTSDNPLGETFSVYVSVYADNTNSMVTCSALDMIGPVSGIPAALPSDKRKLLGSRFDDQGNLIYIFESETYGTAYINALSGEASK